MEAWTIHEQNIVDREILGLVEAEKARAGQGALFVEDVAFALNGAIARTGQEFEDASMLNVDHITPIRACSYEGAFNMTGPTDAAGECHPIGKSIKARLDDQDTTGLAISES